MGGCSEKGAAPIDTAAQNYYDRETQALHSEFRLTKDIPIPPR